MLVFQQPSIMFTKEPWSYIKRNIETKLFNSHGEHAHQKIIRTCFSQIKGSNLGIHTGHLLSMS